MSGCSDTAASLRGTAGVSSSCQGSPVLWSGIRWPCSRQRPLRPCRTSWSSRRTRGRGDVVLRRTCRSWRRRCQSPYRDRIRPWWRRCIRCCSRCVVTGQSRGRVGPVLTGARRGRTAHLAPFTTRPTTKPAVRQPSRKPPGRWRAKPRTSSRMSAGSRLSSQPAALGLLRRLTNQLAGRTAGGAAALLHGAQVACDRAELAGGPILLSGGLPWSPCCALRSRDRGPAASLPGPRPWPARSPTTPHHWHVLGARRHLATAIGEAGV